MALTTVFSLTPRNSHYIVSDLQWASLFVYGACFYNKRDDIDRRSFDHQHTSDELCFSSPFSAESILDCSDWRHRKLAPHVALCYNLSALGLKKELVLAFKYEAPAGGRLRIFTPAECLGDFGLSADDNQFMIHIESPNQLDLYFVHTETEQDRREMEDREWYFKGIEGYLV